MVVFWMVAGMMLGAFYGWLWASAGSFGDGDSESIREWERQQAEWRRDR